MNETLFNELVMSIKDAGQFLRGKFEPSRTFHFSRLDVKAIRHKTELSQSKFANLIGVKVKTLQDWEQERHKPTGTAAALLTIIALEPEMALRALRKQS